MENHIFRTKLSFAQHWRRGSASLYVHTYRTPGARVPKADPAQGCAAVRNNNFIFAFSQPLLLPLVNVDPGFWGWQSQFHHIFGPRCVPIFYLVFYLVFLLCILPCILLCILSSIFTLYFYLVFLPCIFHCILPCILPCTLFYLVFYLVLYVVFLPCILPCMLPCILLCILPCITILFFTLYFLSAHDLWRCLLARMFRLQVNCN